MLAPNKPPIHVPILIYPIFLQKKIVGRILALDFGKVRTGIAVTDELQLIASGLTTVETKNLLPFLQAYAADEKIVKIIVGEPRNTDGSPSESEPLIRAFLPKLERALPSIPIERQDERFTSRIAVKSMIESGLKKKKRRDKALIDEISATLILQAYLNRM